MGKENHMTSDSSFGLMPWHEAERLDAHEQMFGYEDRHRALMRLVLASALTVMALALTTGLLASV
jgi:hypothetical protein